SNRRRGERLDTCQNGERARRPSRAVYVFRALLRAERVCRPTAVVVGLAQGHRPGIQRTRIAVDLELSIAAANSTEAAAHDVRVPRRTRHRRGGGGGLWGGDDHGKPRERARASGTRGAGRTG